MRSAARTGYIDRARKEAIVAETHSCVMAAQTIAAEKYGANAVDVDDDMMDAVDDIKEIAEVDGDISNITMKKAAGSDYVGKFFYALLYEGRMDLHLHRGCYYWF